MPTHGQVVARRIGRITFGGVLLAGLGCLLAAVFSGAIARQSVHLGLRFDAAQIIALTWAIAALAGVVAWRVALRLRLAAHPDALFARSLMVPAAGVALVLPISLHLPIVLALGGREAFDIWVEVCIWITGAAHVVFAIGCVVRGYQLAAGKPAWSPGAIYAATVIAACLPFVVLYGIPPALVAITGLPLLPLLHAMERIATRERRELSDAPHRLPRAIVAGPRRAG